MTLGWARLRAEHGAAGHVRLRRAALPQALRGAAHARARQQTVVVQGAAGGGEAPSVLRAAAALAPLGQRVVEGSSLGAGAGLLGVMAQACRPAPQDLAGPEDAWRTAAMYCGGPTSRACLVGTARRQRASKTLVQSALEPGLATVYCSLAQQTRQGAELYVATAEEVV